MVDVEGGAGDRRGYIQNIEEEAGVEGDDGGGRKGRGRRWGQLWCRNHTGERASIIEREEGFVEGRTGVDKVGLNICRFGLVSVEKFP